MFFHSVRGLSDNYLEKNNLRRNVGEHYNYQ